MIAVLNGRDGSRSRASGDRAINDSADLAHALDAAMTARMAVDGAEFWFADEPPQHLNFSQESLGGGSVGMVLTVESPDAAFERAVAAGAMSNPSYSSHHSASFVSIPPTGLTEISRESQRFGVDPRILRNINSVLLLPGTL